ncbi:MAG TPA: type II secretion system protein [Aggregatilineales bacterium]|nr:type II secretion system protein [Aggregatilineales bacterium]
MRTQRENGFTLVEMLTVLVVIVILSGITLTAMHNIGRSTSLHSASRQIADQINRARNYALVNGTYVYMVVATDQTTSNPNYPFTSFGFCVGAVSNATNIGNPLSNVKYVEPIQSLPPGIVFSNYVVNVGSASVSFPNSGTITQPAWVVTFTSTGQILPLTRTPQFFVHRGTYNPVLMKPVRTELNYDKIEINTLIGKPIVSYF